MIPNGWITEHLGDVSYVTKLAGYEYTEHFDYSIGGEIIVVRAINVTNKGFDLSNIHTVEKSISEKLKSLCEIANNIREINGFKWQSTGHTIKITDMKKLSERLIENGISQDAITNASTISFKNACELAGKSETAFLEEFGDFISKEKKSDTLKRTY